MLSGKFMRYEKPANIQVRKNQQNRFKFKGLKPKWKRGRLG
jgi:hypothetical protein